MRDLKTHSRPIDSWIEETNKYMQEVLTFEFETNAVKSMIENESRILITTNQILYNSAFQFLELRVDVKSLR